MNEHPFTHPLLATEHTEFDAGAERVALDIAARCDLPLDVLVPMVSNPEYEALAPQIAARAEQEVAGRIAHLRELARQAGVRVEARARRGEEPYREIVDDAREHGADLVVVRRRGKRGFLANLLVGEMVSKVVAHATCPVLLVPRHGGMWQHKVLVAVQPGAQGLRLIALAARMAAVCGLPLCALCVTDDACRAAAQDWLTAALEPVARQGVVARSLLRSGRAHAAILETAASEQADLLVLGSRGDTRIGRAMVGGTAQKVIGLAECPVLAVPPHPPKDTHE